MYKVPVILSCICNIPVNVHGSSNSFLYLQHSSQFTSISKYFVVLATFQLMNKGPVILCCTRNFPINLQGSSSSLLNLLLSSQCTRVQLYSIVLATFQSMYKCNEPLMRLPVSKLLIANIFVNYRSSQYLSVLLYSFRNSLWKLTLLTGLFTANFFQDYKEVKTNFQNDGCIPFKIIHIRQNWLNLTKCQPRVILCLKIKKSHPLYNTTVPNRLWFQSDSVVTSILTSDEHKTLLAG